MRKILFLSIFVAIFAAKGFSESRIGFAVGGGAIYPGFQQSSVFGSRFGTGAGFEIFVRHGLMELSPERTLQARYMVRSYFSDTELPFVEDIRFTFAYFSVDIFTQVLKLGTWPLYAGGGASLVNVSGAKDFTDITESILMPEVFVGIEWPVDNSFNLFGEVLIQFGEFNSDRDVLPVTGMRFMIGGTMFLSQVE